MDPPSLTKQGELPPCSVVLFLVVFADGVDSYTALSVCPDHFDLHPHFNHLSCSTFEFPFIFQVTE